MLNKNDILKLMKYRHKNGGTTFKLEYDMELDATHIFILNNTKISTLILDTKFVYDHEKEKRVMDTDDFIKLQEGFDGDEAYILIMHISQCVSKMVSSGKVTPYLDYSYTVKDIDYFLTHDPNKVVDRIERTY